MSARRRKYSNKLHERDVRSPVHVSGGVSPEGPEEVGARQIAVPNLDVLIAGLTVLVDRISQPQPVERRRWPELLNCPFTVTVVGGLIASALTLGWQQLRASIDAEQVRVTAHYSERQRVLSEFSNDLPQAVHRLYQVKQKWIWLHHRASETERVPATQATDILANEYWNGRAEYTELNERYINHKLASAVAAEAFGTFDSDEVRASLRELTQQLNCMFAAETDEDLELHHTKSNELYDSAVTFMCNELKR